MSKTEKHIEYWSNGMMKEEGTLKNGEQDGKWTWWYENGQKWKERTYKDGELFSEKCWDEDGNEIDCPDWMLD